MTIPPRIQGPICSMVAVGFCVGALKVGSEAESFVFEMNVSVLLNDIAA